MLYNFVYLFTFTAEHDDCRSTSLIRQSCKIRIWRSWNFQVEKCLMSSLLRWLATFEFQLSPMITIVKALKGPAATSRFLVLNRTIWPRSQRVVRHQEWSPMRCSLNTRFVTQHELQGSFIPWLLKPLSWKSFSINVGRELTDTRDTTSNGYVRDSQRWTDRGRIARPRWKFGSMLPLQWIGERSWSGLVKVVGNRRIWLTNVNRRKRGKTKKSFFDP